MGQRCDVVSVAATPAPAFGPLSISSDETEGWRHWADGDGAIDMALFFSFPFLFQSNDAAAAQMKVVEIAGQRRSIILFIGRVHTQTESRIRIHIPLHRHSSSPFPFLTAHTQLISELPLSLSLSLLDSHFKMSSALKKSWEMQWRNGVVVVGCEFPVWVFQRLVPFSLILSLHSNGPFFFSFFLFFFLSLCLFQLH